ncbi:MAG: 1-deoxy-D-xylulose-5-phosphate reductoisomerase [Bifidobacteriaceae bacterium]|jgi:1-deoxy-D-xylulose-5-phosphate reductoisomerase|nr:1-deoxy-D-xylulose-5-phosphate reductoisomerase [Bifidobacteriaceae bacterium]
MPKKIVVLGSTGSIGRQALEIIRQNPSQFSVLALGAYGNNKKLFTEQIAEFKPKKYATVLDDGIEKVNLLAGEKCDIVLNGIAGSAGIESSVNALEKGNYLALANKESLVVGGEYLLSKVKFPNQIVPVDSEHSAIWQCLQSGKKQEISRLILTASGGPFRNFGLNELKNITPEQALAHPTWDMGKLVTINSSNMVNKALEIIEAHYLFGIDIDKIDVVIQPTSFVHSMVEFFDGSTIMQVSAPDMKLPIALALNYPDRLENSIKPVSFLDKKVFEFEPLDNNKFPIIQFTKNFFKNNKNLSIVFNAANEELVKAFLNKKIAYLDIVQILQKIVSEYKIGRDIVNIDMIYEVENDVRKIIRSFIS